MSFIDKLQAVKRNRSKKPHPMREEDVMIRLSYVTYLWLLLNEKNYKTKKSIAFVEDLANSLNLLPNQLWDIRKIDQPTEEMIEEVSTTFDFPYQKYLFLLDLERLFTEIRISAAYKEDVRKLYMDLFHMTLREQHFISLLCEAVGSGEKGKAYEAFSYGKNFGLISKWEKFSYHLDLLQLDEGEVQNGDGVSSNLEALEDGIYFIQKGEGGPLFKIPHEIHNEGSKEWKICSLRVLSFKVNKRWIYFTAYKQRSKTPSLFRCHLDGTETKELVKAFSYDHFFLYNDRIYYFTRKQLLSIGIDGSEKKVHIDKLTDSLKLELIWCGRNISLPNNYCDAFSIDSKEKVYLSLWDKKLYFTHTKGIVWSYDISTEKVNVVLDNKGEERMNILDFKCNKDGIFLLTDKGISHYRLDGEMEDTFLSGKNIVEFSAPNEEGILYYVSKYTKSQRSYYAIYSYNMKRKKSTKISNESGESITIFRNWIYFYNTWETIKPLSRVTADKLHMFPVK
ncbi:DUF5050 domain-containing protein [Evansella sp. AB-P1]|uniref:DUF5050 domain-containing protein n=1 Tax=Evansella sp. AB-P1 TaxID=3037653 RepID=UPI00241FECB7|nr:DUF5050 domain-containing protein [Evansella sp. AB-P1]MDG5789326.1 DUF5050 domain-containing protein [Evansella sp. AB-P1]